MGYSAEVWARVKADYETGNFSVDALQKRYGISTATIDKHMAKEKWVKGSLKPVIEGKIKETTAQMFARIGLPREKVLKTILEGIEKATKTLLSKDGPIVEKDWVVIDKMITQYNKMTGGYLERIDLTSGGDKMNSEIKIEVVRGRDEN